MIGEKIMLLQKKIVSFLLGFFVFGIIFAMPSLLKAENGRNRVTMPEKKLAYIVVKAQNLTKLSDKLKKGVSSVENQVIDSVYVGILVQDASSSYLKKSSQKEKFTAHMFFLTKNPDKVKNCKIVKNLILNIKCKFLPDPNYLFMPNNGLILEWKEKAWPEPEKFLQRLRKQEVFTYSFKPASFLASSFTEKKLKKLRKLYLRSVHFYLEVENDFGITYSIADSIYFPNTIIGH